MLFDSGGSIIKISTQAVGNLLATCGSTSDGEQTTRYLGLIVVPGDAGQMVIGLENDFCRQLRIEGLTRTDTRGAEISPKR